MPTYTYKCEKCVISFVRIVPIKDRDGQDCERCSNSLKRKIDSPASVWAPTSTGGGHK